MIIKNYYSRENLISLWLYTHNEINRVKQNLNSSVLSKYTSIGWLGINYRSELKKELKRLTEDLIEDFNFDPFTRINNPLMWEKYNILDTILNGKKYIINDNFEFLITFGELIELLKVVDYNPLLNEYYREEISILSIDDLISNRALLCFIEGDNTKILKNYFSIGTHNGIYKLIFNFPKFSMNYQDLCNKQSTKELVEKEILEKNITDPVIINSIYAKTLLEVRRLKNGKN